MNDPAPVPAPEVPRHKLPSTVVWLGVVSFLTDASSDMIYPLLPLFLASVLGAAPAFIGVVEGIAETTASLLKLVSGWIADRFGRKKPLTVLGYSLSSLSRPLVALATAPWMVLAIRFVDRVGKGLRSSPRDAIVAQVTPPERRGAAYGYHRAMDNAGAVLGPLIGWVLLTSAHFELRTIFALAAIPAALAVTALIVGVREPREPADVAAHKNDAAAHKIDAATHDTGAASQHAASGAPGSLRRYLVAVAVFTLANASDAFLLLRAREAGVSQSSVLLLWTLHNGVKALLSRRFGALSDRLGRRRLIGAGWVLYTLTYVGFGLAARPWQIWALFAVYGLYYALVEGSERALVADLAGARFRGRAFGWFHAIVGLGALPSSLGFGWLYQRFGAPTAFSTAGALALVAAVLLALTTPAPSRDRA